MDHYRKNNFLCPLDPDIRNQPLAQGSNGRNSFCGHVGSSMNPTLSDRDLLEIAPYTDERKPQVGDVILFLPPQLNYPVMHRIIKISSRGIRTRGDNCRDADPWRLKNENIYGRLIGADTGSRQRKIASGLLGRLTGRYCHIRRLAMTRMVRLLGPVYRALCTGGSLHWLIPVRLNPRPVAFGSGSNTSHKLLLGGLVLGVFDPIEGQWQVRRPYRLLVNESSLPAPRF